MQIPFTQDMFEMMTTMYTNQLKLEHQIDEMQAEINDLRNDIQGLLPEPELIHEPEPTYKNRVWNDDETASLKEIYDSQDHWTQTTITNAYNKMNSLHPKSVNQVKRKVYGLINKGVVPNKFGEMPDCLRRNKQ